MNKTKRRLLGACAGVAGVALPLLAVGTAHADDEREGYPSTQSPLQAVDAVGATGGNMQMSLMDALNGDDRPDGANGVETEFPPADPRYVEGPVGGLLNGPFD